MAVTGQFKALKHSLETSQSVSNQGAPTLLKTPTLPVMQFTLVWLNLHGSVPTDRMSLRTGPKNILEDRSV